jgi:hypothetical protein
MSRNTCTGDGGIGGCGTLALCAGAAGRTVGGSAACAMPEATLTATIKLRNIIALLQSGQ